PAARGAARRAGRRTAASRPPRRRLHRDRRHAVALPGWPRRHRAPGPRSRHTGHTMTNLELRPIGTIASELKSLRESPRQGNEGAPNAWLEVHAWAADAL